jgi:DNA polymerase III delta prime subunit
MNSTENPNHRYTDNNLADLATQLERDKRYVRDLALQAVDVRNRLREAENEVIELKARLQKIDLIGREVTRQIERQERLADEGTQR